MGRSGSKPASPQAPAQAPAPARTPASLQRRVFLALAGMAVAAAVLASAASAAVLQSSLLADARGMLEQECSVAASALEGEPDAGAALARMDFGDERTTLVASDGAVLYDSEADASGLPSHLSRPEVAEALSTGAGSAERASETTGYVSIYQAVRLGDGSVLRLSEDRAGALVLFREGLGALLAVLACLVAASWAASRALARRLVRPVLEMDPASPEARPPYRELQPLVARLQKQQAQLERQMERIRDADVMRQEFTANVTHELKTPIASISGAAELIRDGVARPEDVRDFAGRIYGDAQRLSSLVSDILTLSKLDESERSQDTALLGARSTCDLLSVARDVLDRLADKAAAAHVEMTLQGTPALVDGYPRLLDELVGNLVDNAVRYNVEGGSVRVEVGELPGGGGPGGALPADGHDGPLPGRPSSAGGTPLASGLDGAPQAGQRAGRPFVRVSDTGVGIPKEDQPKVFERFYRVDKSRSRASGGTGLGLAIVKHAANVHGAEISLVSEPGRGTTVTVAFSGRA